MQKQFQSPVGCVVDIATPAKGKLRALGAVWALIALFPIVIINYLLIQVLTSPNPLVTKSLTTFLGSLLMPVLAWYSLGSAVQRFRAASTDGRYFRSGPGGISVYLPDDYASSTFLFSLKTLKFDMPWDQIKTWYPFVQSMNGFPTERAIVFETLRNEKIKIKTYHFAEKQQQIVASITRSRSIVPEEAVAASIEEPAAEQQFRVPPSAGELSLEFKKKKDRVKEIDLTTVGKFERAACIERIADTVEVKVISLYPNATGFKCSRKRYRPFKEWQDVFGIRLFLRRGLLDGYEIQVEPNDSDSRRLTISICHSSLITDIRRYITMGVGGLFLVVSFLWWSDVQYWLGNSSEFTPIVMLAMFVAVIAIATGLLQLPISLLRLLLSDKQRDEAQKQGIKLGIQEMTI